MLAYRPKADLAFRSAFNSGGKKGGFVGSLNEPGRVISIL
jgi:hypothetical protein